MNQLILIYLLSATGPNIPDSHLQRITYPTQRSCMTALAHVNPQVIDKHTSYCKPINPDPAPFTASKEFIQSTNTPASNVEYTEAH